MSTVLLLFVAETASLTTKRLAVTPDNQPSHARDKHTKQARLRGPAVRLTCPLRGGGSSQTVHIAETELIFYLFFKKRLKMFYLLPPPDPGRSAILITAQSPGGR